MTMIKGSNHEKCKFDGDLYHSDVFMPAVLRKKAMAMFGTFKSKTTFPAHVIRNINCDKCHQYDINKIYEAIAKVDTAKVKLFEVGTEYSLSFDSINDSIIKFAVRMPYDDAKDVIIVYTSEGGVKTAWLNDKNDIHHTLDKGKYVHQQRKR